MILRKSGWSQRALWDAIEPTSIGWRALGGKRAAKVFEGIAKTCPDLLRDMI